MKLKEFDSLTNNYSISDTEAIKLFKSASLLELTNLATQIRFAHNPEPIVTYIVDRNINYTNICKSRCKFCAFYRDISSPHSYLLNIETLFKKIEQTIALGGEQILLQGGINPDLKLEYFEELFRAIKSKYDIKLHALSPPEIVFLAESANLSVLEVLTRLIDAGLDSIPGGGAEILADRVRTVLSPGKCSTDEWLDVMHKAHQLGLRSTATMMFGHIETIEERVEHLRKIRDLQNETGGFTAFIPWTFQPLNTSLESQKVTPVDYLKTLAISRIYLNNVIHIQASWVTQGARVAQMALHFGADDFGSVMIEENVVRSAGVEFSMTEKEIVKNIESAGFAAERRDMKYNIIGEHLCHQK